MFSSQYDKMEKFMKQYNEYVSEDAITPRLNSKLNRQYSTREMDDILKQATGECVEKVEKRLEQFENAAKSKYVEYCIEEAESHDKCHSYPHDLHEDPFKLERKRHINHSSKTHHSRASAHSHKLNDEHNRHLQE